MISSQLIGVDMHEVFCLNGLRIFLVVQEAVAITTAIQEEILLEMGIGRLMPFVYEIFIIELVEIFKHFECAVCFVLFF